MGGLTEMPKVGDELRYVGKEYSFLTAGKTYKVTGLTDYEAFRYNDDDGDNLAVERSEFHEWELVTEETEPSPSIHDLLANLGRRLSEVEAQLAPKECEVAPEDSTEVDANDAVNSPQHYRRGKYETIEVIEHITAGYDDPFVAYCVGNAVKYLDRAPYKHDSPEECLRKAAWYITRAAEHTEASE